MSTFTPRETALDWRTRTAGLSRSRRVIGVALAETLTAARASLLSAQRAYRAAQGTPRHFVREPDDATLSAWLEDAERETTVVEARLAALTPATDAGRTVVSSPLWLR